MKRVRGETETHQFYHQSFIGNIRKCECCDSYHLSLGSITLCLHHRDILILTEMLIEVLELNAMHELNEREYRGKNA